MTEMRKNAESLMRKGDKKPVWLDKAFHALLDENHHAQGHGIDAHTDTCSLMFSKDEPH